MQEIELKKCPYCGGEAHVYSTESCTQNKMYYGVDCDSDECIVHTMVADYETAEEAIEAWNRRV